MASRRIVNAGALLALSLSGCALLGGQKQLDTYDLSAPENVAQGKRAKHLQVLIAEPSAIKSFDGQNIVIKPSPGEIQYLKGAQWADRLPRVVQARLVEAFQKSGRFGGVGRPGEGLAIDDQIIADIRAFDIRVNGGATAEVALYVRVLNDRNGVVRASKLFSATSPVVGGNKENNNPAFINALDRAFTEVASQIVSWSASVM